MTRWFTAHRAPSHTLLLPTSLAVFASIVFVRIELILLLLFGPSPDDIIVGKSRGIPSVWSMLWIVHCEIAGTHEPRYSGEMGSILAATYAAAVIALIALRYSSTERALLLGLDRFLFYSSLLFVASLLTLSLLAYTHSPYSTEEYEAAYRQQILEAPTPQTIRSYVTAYASQGKPLPQDYLNQLDRETREYMHRIEKEIELYRTFDPFKVHFSDEIDALDDETQKLLREIQREPMRLRSYDRFKP